MKKDKTGERIFYTQGLANDEVDPAITGKQIMGVIVCKIPVLSQIAKIINNLYSFYFIVFIPLAVLIGLELRKIILHFSKREE